MKAFVLKADSFELEDIQEPVCPDGFSRVRVLYTSLNHRDQYIREGKYAQIRYPVVLGSDICGVMAPDANSSEYKTGQRIIVDPSMQWGDDYRAQGPNYNPIGMPSQGALAEYVCVPDANVYPAPSHLTAEQAACVPMAGVTAYRALFTRGSLQRNETILITGVGGGVATFILQFAVAAGAHVIVSSRSQEKLVRALELGAHDAIRLEQHEDTFVMSAADKKKLKELSIDVIADSVGGDTVNDLTDVLKPGGRLVFYGTSKGAVPNLNLHRIYWKQLTLLGTTMGTSKDFVDMLSFISVHGIVPIVDSVYDLEHTISAFDRIRSGDQFGKIVVRVSE
jgi:NADPH:quinone reductase-like Zn-dependent oxidoreductase